MTMNLKTNKGNEIIQLLSGRSNVFIIKHASGGVVMVDSSVKHARRQLTWALKQQKIDKIEYLILTHCHYDHAANANFIRNTAGARTVIHKSEAECLSKGVMEIPEGTNVVTDKLVAIARKINFTITVEPCQADIQIDDNFQLPGFEGIMIIHTPGHSKGSVSILVDDEIALVGDTMVNVALFKIFPPFAEDTLLLKQSWQKLLATPCNTFLPSHGNAVNRNDLDIALQELEKKLQSDTEPGQLY